MILLNTVFMVACKHLPRTEDTMRAIEFRERVRGMTFLEEFLLATMPIVHMEMKMILKVGSQI
jgi:hypothetical protein